MALSYDAMIVDPGRVITAFEPNEFVHRIVSDRHHATCVRRAVFGSPSWKLIDQGLITEADAEARIVAENLELAGAIHDVFSHYKEFLVAIPEGVEILERTLHSGLRAYGIANVGADAWKSMTRRFGFIRLFNGFVVSFQEKLLKPDPAIFEKLIARYDIEPKRCVFTADEPRSVEAARHFGFDGIHFRNHRQLTEALEARGIFQFHSAAPAVSHA
jgi:putative hydrolase of the HAD superfamily